MEIPEPNTLISFAEVQEAIAAMNEAWEDAVDEVIEDESVALALRAAVAGNIFDAAIRRVQVAQEIAQALDPKYNPVEEDPGAALRRLMLSEEQDKLP